MPYPFSYDEPRRQMPELSQGMGQLAAQIQPAAQPPPPSPAQGRMQDIAQRMRGAMGGGMQPPQGQGPFGGQVAMKGQGGFQAGPQATMARVQQPGKGASPYGPIQPREGNTPQRIGVRSRAMQMMLRGRGGSRGRRF